MTAVTLVKKHNCFYRFLCRGKKNGLPLQTQKWGMELW